MKTESTASLTHGQRILLSNAAEREDGACAIPPRPDRRAAQKSISSLIERSLVSEVPAATGMPVWRDDDNGHSLALVITKQGRDAVHIVAELGSKPADACPVPDEPGAAAHSPRAGGVTINAHTSGSEPVVGNARRRRSPDRTVTNAAISIEAPPRRTSKKATIEALVRREDGATISQMINATGWQQHSIRAALTSLRKAGFTVARERDEQGGSTYRLLGAS